MKIVMSDREFVKDLNRIQTKLTWWKFQADLIKSWEDKKK